MDWETIRNQHFPSLKNMTYLNTASLGIPPITAMKAAEEWLEERMYGNVHWMEWYQELNELREQLSILLKASPNEIGFVQNTSMGLNLVANSIGWEKGDSIVTNDMEFPANKNIWQKIAKKYGLELRVAKNRDGEIPIEEYEKLVDETTKVIALSWVEFSNGFKHDLESIVKLGRKFSSYIIVDGIQGVGSLEMDVKTAGIDFMSVGGHKWMLGLPGSGFFYARKKFLEELETPFAGWLSAEKPFDFASWEYEEAQDAKKYELGSPSFIGYRFMLESVKLINKIGISRIQERNLKLARYLIENLPRNVELLSKFHKPEPISPIVSITVKEHEKLYKQLVKEKVITAMRGKGIRVSLHFYNSEDDIDKLIQMINEQK